MRSRKSNASSLLSVFTELIFTLGSVKMIIRLSSSLERLEWHGFTDSASSWKGECRTNISENDLGYMTVIPASYTYEGRRVKSSKPASVTRSVWDTCDSVWKHKHFYYFFQTIFFIMYFQLHPDPPHLPTHPTSCYFSFKRNEKQQQKQKSKYTN